MPGTSAWQQLKGPSRLTRIVACNSASGYCHSGAVGPATPALFTRMSTRPNAASGRACKRDVAIPERDPGTGGNEALRDRAADALGAAGDDGDAVCEVDLVGHFILHVTYTPRAYTKRRRPRP